MLRQLVQANLEERHGLLPRRLRRSRVSLALLARVFAVAMVIVLSSVAGSRVQDPPVREAESRPVSGSAFAVEPASSTRVEAGAPLASQTALTGGLAPEAVVASEPPRDAALLVTDPIDPAVLRLAIRRIVIDPGHGGMDPGARTLTGISEKDIALDIARRLAVLLREEGFDVAMTRESDETISLRERCARANAERADLFLSIHLNSIPQENRGGVETYYVGPSSDPRVELIAGAENADSGYSLADLRTVLEGVYANIHANEARRLAEAVHRQVYDSLRRTTPALENRGVKRAPFVVLVATEMPAILAEVSSISNPEEAALLDQSSYRQRIAEALAGGIRSYAGSHGRPETVASASRVALNTKGH